MNATREEKVQSRFTARLQEFDLKTAHSRRASRLMSRGRLSLAASLVLLSGAVFAGPPGGRGPAAAPMPEPRMVRTHESRPEEHSLAEAVRRVERATGGQILSAERVPFDGRDMNRIKVLDSTGRVRVITDDPERRRPRNDD